MSIKFGFGDRDFFEQAGSGIDAGMPALPECISST